MKPKAVCAMLKVLPLNPMSLYMRYSKYFLYSIHGHGFRLGNILGTILPKGPQRTPVI